jgi:uncharacterized membrane-anchored protein YitT (DUF2179 family)
LPSFSIVNLPFVAVYRQIGLSFAIRSALGIAGLASSSRPYVSGRSHDPLLTAVVGGFFLARASALPPGGAVLDGTEITALPISKRSHILKSVNIPIFNVVLFVVAMSVLGVEPALY